LRPVGNLFETDRFTQSFDVSDAATAYVARLDGGTGEILIAQTILAIDADGKGRVKQVSRPPLLAKRSGSTAPLPHPSLVPHLPLPDTQTTLRHLPTECSSRHRGDLKRSATSPSPARGTCTSVEWSRRVCRGICSSQSTASVSDRNIAPHARLTPAAPTCTRMYVCRTRLNIDMQAKQGPRCRAACPLTRVRPARDLDVVQRGGRRPFLAGIPAGAYGLYVASYWLHVARCR
jgi:hypothetical protein